jgi:hypothetical protein
VFLHLPFEGEVKDIALTNAAPDGSKRVGWDEAQAMASDDLIDAMRLKPGELEPESVPSPALRCWSQALVQRFSNPTDGDIVGDHIRPPRVAESKDALDQFWAHFSLPSVDAKRKAESLRETKNDQGTRRKRALYYKDWL